MTVWLFVPTGTGKTTLAHVIARHCGFRVVEVNASDARTAASLTRAVTDAAEMAPVLDGEPLSVSTPFTAVVIAVAVPDGLCLMGVPERGIICCCGCCVLCWRVLFISGACPAHTDTN